jgi:hypothetical protein
LPEINKDHLYGVFQRWSDWTQGLAKQATYKALDMAPDDMNIHGGNQFHYHPPVTPPVAMPVKTGLGTLAQLAIGAGLLGTGVGAGAGIPLLLDALRPKPPVVVHDPGETKTIIKQGRAHVVARPAVIVDEIPSGE